VPVRFRHHLKHEAVIDAFKSASLLTFKIDVGQEAEVFWRRLGTMGQPYEMHEEAKSILVRAFGVEAFNEDGLRDLIKVITQMLPEPEYNCFADRWLNDWDEKS